MMNIVISIDCQDNIAYSTCADDGIMTPEDIGSYLCDRLKRHAPWITSVSVVKGE
jgi:hypothetical protein